MIYDSLSHISKSSAVGIDGIEVETAKKDFDLWIGEMLSSVHRKSYRPPGQYAGCGYPSRARLKKRPIGVPSVADRALQRSTATVLNAIYEQDFLNCSFGGRPGRSAHNALASMNSIIMGKKINWVLEADLKNFFGSLDHGWLVKFVEHRVGDPRIISLIRR